MKVSGSENLLTISVLIGTRNRPEALKRCLKSVLSQDYANFEVLILDDGSDSCDVCDLIQELMNSRVRYFRAPQPLGVAGGRNWLMELAKGDVFCVIDDDAYFDSPYALTKIAEVLSRNPDIGIIAVKVVDHRGGKIGLLVPFSKWTLFRHPDLIDREVDVSYFLGTCHAIRRKVIEICGPYQPDLVYGEEELDLSYRAVQNDFRIRYIPDVIVHHYSHASVVQSPGSMRHPELYYHTRNRILIASKYLPYRYLIFYLAFWTLRYFVLALQTRALLEFVQGLVAGFRVARKVKRASLSPQAVTYLRKHYGRLWY